MLNFLKLQKSFKKLFDPTRKGTLTVPFHTILPSESFGKKVTDNLGGGKPPYNALQKTRRNRGSSAFGLSFFNG